ncbi:MAG: iron-sulfur cluster carrier protein ApbC [Gemmatimonadales bacterium]|nr:MAG: iron-sulfur cluster carrier protein ApbC [Gemmatimonadales bacterium]
MTQNDMQEQVLAALRGVLHPHTGDDLLSAGYVRDVEIRPDGEVRFAFTLQPQDPGSLVKQARSAVQAVDGVERVKVNVQLPQAGTQAPASAPARPRPTPSPKPSGGGGGLQPGSVPAPTPKPGILAETDHVVAVSSGKGGVGKSMVASNLAAALADQGLRVGLLDADIYGPNIPRMFGESRRPRVTGGKGTEMIEPLEAHGVRLMSLGFLLEEEQPAIMRGPLIAGILRQFLEQVDWGPLDVMVVDMPPGTGDAQLSLVQTIDVDGAVMVSTPQAVALGDVRRGVKMFERVNTRVLGIVENMAGEVFGSGGGEALAEEMGLDFLGRIPLDPAVRQAGDAGKPTVLAAPDSPAGQALAKVAEAVFKALHTAKAAGASG